MNPEDHPVGIFRLGSRLEILLGSTDPEAEIQFF
jgi:hypothetical protein